MSPSPEEPVEIAALKPHQARAFHLLAPGSGTPWEDRGSVGVVPAFFKTAFGAMFSPRRLMASIRRPETVSDARSFAIVCTFFWGLGWLAWDIIRYVRKPNPEGFDLTTDGTGWLIHFALGMGGSWLLIVLVSRLFHSLVTAGGTSSKAPPSLSFNIIAYAMGPSLLAIIPFMIGPGLALVWIVLVIIIGAAARLHTKPVNAIVCTLMATGGLIGASVGAYFLARVILRWLGYIPS